MRLSTSLSLLASLFILASAEHRVSKRNHVPVSKREGTGSSVSRRGGDAQFTYYQDGLGACGKTNQPNDFIVALNSQDFNAGSHCFDMITITIGGKSSQAMIVDECMGCGPGNLDFSEGLFKFFGSEAAGVLHGSWSYGSGDPKPSPSSSPSPKAKPSPSPSPSPSPKPSPKLSSSKAKPSSTKVKPSSSSSVKPSTTPSPSATSSSAAPNVDVQTAGALPSQEANASNIYSINMAFMGLSGLIASA